MPGDANIAVVASVLADATRVTVLNMVGDGRAYTAKELARQAGVSPSTMSMHLTKLMEYDLLTMEKQGRHHYFRLANPAIIRVLEDLAMFAPAKNVRTLRDATVADAVRQARTCYNHLAGKLGVELTEALLQKSFLQVVDDGYVLSQTGEQWAHNLGIQFPVRKAVNALFVPRHIDWSERRHHVAGTFGAALTSRLFELEWVRRIPTSRAVRVTEEGQRAFHCEFGLKVGKN